jgi:hypothetical protein
MIKINKDNKIEIYGITPIYQNGEISYFSTVISIAEIGKTFNKLTYDSSAQRGSIHTSTGDVPRIDIKHTRQIKNTILNGDKIRGNLTWNIRISDELKDDDVEYFTYNPNKNSLIINSNTITQPDSAHRHLALYEISQEETDDELLNYQFGLDIYNMTYEEEKTFFTDINSKGKPVCRNRTLFLSNDLKCLLLKDIINNSNLYNKVECEKDRTPSDKLLKFSTLYDSIFGTIGAYKNININNENYDDYKKWFVKFYNELLHCRDEFNNITIENFKQQNKQISMLLEEISWWAYSYISNKIQKQDYWKRTLNNKLNKKNNVQGMTPIDFWSKTNPAWDCIRCYNLNAETGEIQLTSSVYNSNSTRNKVQNIVALNLFS